MSLPQKEEHGVKVFAWNASDPAAGVPIKKRRFLFRRSPSPPPSHSTIPAAESCDVHTKETTFPVWESSVSGVPCQVPNTGCADLRGSSLKEEKITDGEVNLALNCGSSPGFSEGLPFTLNSVATIGIGNGGSLIFENGSAFYPNLGSISETSEFKPPLGDGSCGNKLILSDKSAFQRVLAKTDLRLPFHGQCEPSLGESILPVSSAKEGQSSSYKLELTLSESQSSTPGKQTDSGLGFGHNSQHSNRSHWDLNTTMDTWERSIVDATWSYGEAGNDQNLNLGMHQRRSEMDPVEKNHQESTSYHVMSGKHALSESGCSLKLSDTLKPPSENSCTNADLNLQLNTTFHSMSPSNVSVPFASIPSAHKTLSVKPLTLTQSPSVAARDAVKTEPLEDSASSKNIGVMDSRSDKNIGASNVKVVNHIIKSEALDVVEQEVTKAICPNVMGMAFGGAVKSEQPEVRCLEGTRATKWEVQYPGCCTNTQEMADTREMHHDTKREAAWSLDLAAQGLNVDYNKAHDIPGAPNVDMSQAVRESFSDVMPMSSEKPMVLNDTKPDLGQDMPSASQSHGACPITDSSVDLTSKYVTSDGSDSQNVHLTSLGILLQDAEVSALKASDLFCESTAKESNQLGQVKGAREVEDSRSSLDPESQEQTVANHTPGIDELVSYSDGAQLPGFVSVDVHTLHPSPDCNVNETDMKRDIKEPDSCKIENEACGSHKTVGVRETASKQHGDDDDYEDGEFRESVLRDAIKGSCNAKEKKSVSIEEDVKVDVPVMISLLVSGGESELQNPDESKDVHCTVETEVHLCTEKTDAGLNMMDDAKESSAIGMPITESSKKRTVKISRKMSQESGKEGSETKSMHKKVLSSSHARGSDDTGDDLGCQKAKSPVDQSGPSKTDVSPACDVIKRVRSRSDQDHIMHLSSPTNALSGRTKPSDSRSSSRSERERSKEKSLRREKVHMKSSRDDRHFHRMQKSEKERDQDQALRKAGSNGMHIRRRLVQPLDALHGDWDADRGYAPEHFNMSTSSQHCRPKNASEVAFTVGVDGIFESAGRMGKKLLDNELCRPLPRRPSPGGRGPPPVGVQLVRRTMRDISPDDMVNSSPILRPRPNYEPGGNCLVRRERSLSPFQRRAAPHSSHIPFATSTRPRARSPHLWSPRRSPDVFDGHSDLIRCRSPDPRVERVRSPCERACFEDSMLGRRHISPHIPQLHGEMTDVSLIRGHDLPKPGRHPQGNLRRFDLIDHRVNAESFGHLQASQFHGLEGDDVFVEERRNADDGHGLARPFRQHYIVGDDVGNDGSFHHRVEDIPPRPMRLCQDVDEEFPGRGISRVGSIRNRLGNMHRRLRGMDGQEDNYRHDNGQGWHGASPKDVRLKRRRF